MPSRLPALALAIPGMVVALGSAGLGLMTLAGVNPFWSEQPVNISEAAALRDSATVLRLIQRGEDLAPAHRVRAGVLFDRAVTLTPVEAAVAARRAEVVDAILSSRRLEATDWQRAFCVAAAAPDEDIREVVNAHRPADATDADCAGYTRPW
ncbi:MAG TPA: hypothetical protein VGQ37_17205 [Vicinamibacterales bacterium]|jgi:hypothetical protein|nr:hypothetical protein [Vicinamibacterales bacterium]